MIKVDVEQFRALAHSGGVVSVTLEGQGKDFVLAIETRGGPAMLVLANDKDKQRTFVDPRRALLLLRELGLLKAHINLEGWNPKAGLNVES
ncbi:hypothetical protein [Streptomyces cyaneofuscatus]|uniref:hypothetical protein n=1 Tax=Streptomyces cyaneofuscatus TaxID=66883 RepID=UPI002FEEC3D4